MDSQKGLTLVEMADGVTIEEIKATTRCPFEVRPECKPFIANEVKVGP